MCPYSVFDIQSYCGISELELSRVDCIFPDLRSSGSSIFSSAVFEETIEVFSYPCCHYRHAKTLTFSTISAITEDIHLKLRLPW